jgi:Glyoxalase/Bleomycin resistance protein/Dioxygenase superfamily
MHGSAVLFGACRKDAEEPVIRTAEPRLPYISILTEESPQQPTRSKSRWIISGQLHAGVGDHIGLAVDDFDTAMADLRAQGVEFLIEPTDMGFAKFAFIKDVAGTTLEVLQRVRR